MIDSTFECDTYSSTIIHKNLSDEELVTIQNERGALNYGLYDDDNKTAALINVLGNRNRLRNIIINKNELLPVHLKNYRTKLFFHKDENGK